MEGTDETLYRSDRTLSAGIESPDGVGSVIRKEPLGVDAVRRVRHARTMLRRLTGDAGVVRLPDDQEPKPLLLVDAGGVLSPSPATLATLPRRGQSVLVNLRAVAAAMSRLIWGDDLIAPTGGEKFVIILPGYGLSDAIDVGHRNCQAVENLDFVHTVATRRSDGECGSRLGNPGGNSGS